MFESERQLEDALSEPPPEAVEALARLPGDIILLGVGGKLGPTLARMAKRASDVAGVRRRVIGVSRFSAGGEEELQAHGIETIRCDLLDESAVAQLPEVPNVVFLAGFKFGSTGNEGATWTWNCHLPAIVCRKFRSSRIVAFSTGNIYGMTPVTGYGSREGDVPAPVGEYAMSCLGRERIFEYFSRTFGIPTVVIRLNYACELRYGVVVDLARRIHAGEDVPLAMGHFNVIWQGDVAAITWRSFERAAVPPWLVNVTGPEVLSVRTVCERFGRLMNRPVRFAGAEADTALLSDARRSCDVFGRPRVGIDQMLEWVADWVSRGGANLGKPTHFESRDGRF